MEEPINNLRQNFSGFGVSREGSFYAWGALTGIALTFIAIYIARKKF